MRYARKIYLLSAGCIILIFILNLIAQKYSLYWTIYWFDNMMHFLGGVWLGLCAYIVADRYSFLPTPSSTPFFVILTTLVLGGGIAWEVLEGIVGAYFDTKILQPDTLDTITDLVFDVMGGLGVAIIIALTHPSSSRNYVK